MTRARSPVIPKITRTSAGWGPPFACRFTGQSISASRRARQPTTDVMAYAARVIPWIIIAVIAVPLVVVAFVAMRRDTAKSRASHE